MVTISSEEIEKTLLKTFSTLIKEGLKGYELIELGKHFLLKSQGPSAAYINNLYLTDFGKREKFERPYGPYCETKQFLDYYKENPKYFDEPHFMAFFPLEYNSKWRVSSSTISKRRRVFMDELKQECEDMVPFEKIDIIEIGTSAVTETISEDVGFFIAAQYFKNQGYLVGLLPELSWSGSEPDLFAFQSPIVERLLLRRLITGGVIAEELATLRICKRIGGKGGERAFKQEAFVIEVEPSMTRSGGGLKQLQGQYLKSGKFDRGLLVTPFRRDYQITGVDVLTFDTDGIAYISHEAEHGISEEQVAKVFGQLERSVKKLLINNLYQDEIANLVDLRGKTAYQVYKALEELRLEIILDEICKVTEKT